MSGEELIAAERTRQKEVEGWTAEHDDKHTDGGLALAAAVYAADEPIRVNRFIENGCGCRSVGECMHWMSGKNKWVSAWPWAEEDHKEHSRIRKLTIAGALIAAEIDRLQRIQEAKSDG